MFLKYLWWKSHLFGVLKSCFKTEIFLHALLWVSTRGFNNKNITHITLHITHGEFFAKNRVSGKCGEIRWNTVTLKNRTTEKQRKPEQTDALRLVCTVIFKYDYGNGAAGTHPLRISQLFKLNVRLKYWNTVEIQWNTVEIRFFATNSLWPTVITSGFLSWHGIAINIDLFQGEYCNWDSSSFGLKLNSLLIVAVVYFFVLWSRERD